MTTKDDRDELLHDGQALRVPLTMMDAKTVLDDGLVGGLHRPGFRITTDAAAVTRAQEARDEYENTLTNAWRANDQGEGSPCKSPTGEAGILKYASGRLVCVPRDAAKTSDRKLLDTDLDDGDLREMAYALYDQDLASRWKGE